MREVLYGQRCLVASLEQAEAFALEAALTRAPDAESRYEDALMAEAILHNWCVEHLWGADPTVVCDALSRASRDIVLGMAGRYVRQRSVSYGNK